MPYFRTNDELYSHLKNNTLLYNTCLIKPQHKIADEKYHYYTFDLNYAFQHSDEPQEDEIQSFGELLSHIGDYKNDYALSIEEFTSSLASLDIGEQEEHHRSAYPTIAYQLLDC